VAPTLAEAYAEVKSVGPLATFDVSESWVDHPYREGVALLGDAGATSDPTFGQGMSTTLRDLASCATHSLTTLIGTRLAIISHASMMPISRTLTGSVAGSGLCSKIQAPHKPYGNAPCHELQRIYPAFQIICLAVQTYQPMTTCAVGSSANVDQLK
jgi:hypothetical protein